MKYPISTSEEIKRIVDINPQYRDMLFAKGYFFTSNEKINGREYPFYNEWKVEKVGFYNLFVHHKETLFKKENNSIKVYLIGHAYNPYTMIYDENALLTECVCACETLGIKGIFDKIYFWTGVYTLFVFYNNQFFIVTDACSMKQCYYCKNDEYIYISSHSQLIADILSLKMSRFVKTLRSKKLYNVGLRWLPGNLTPYNEVKRLGANLYLGYQNNEFSVKRFFPSESHSEFTNENEYNDGINSISKILRNTLILCKNKWNNPAISLTGGMDSKATFAASKGFTKDFDIFSFDCKKSEQKDSFAAQQICQIVGVDHKQYHIPDLNNQIVDFDYLAKLINHNTAYVHNLSEPEIRKICYLRNNFHNDVEIKSDAAEIGRTFYCRKYDMEMPNIISSKQISIFQTRFLFMPILRIRTIKEYSKFLKQVNLDKPILNYEHADLLYWEFRIGVSASLTTQSLNIAETLTFPYNNRYLLDLFLAFPHNMRKRDFPQMGVISNNMPEIMREDLNIKDGYYDKYRLILEKLFFVIKSIIPW